MKKFIVLLVVLALAMISIVPTFAAEEKAFQLTKSGDGLGDKIDYPWMNLYILGGLTWRTLFFVETDMATLGPDLASGYEVSEDGLTYTIDFIGGKWSDGEDLTIDDVVFSIKANLKAAASNGIYTSAFSKIEGAEAWRDGTADDLAGLSVDGNKLIIKLSSPHNTLPNVLAQFAILPEHCLKDADLLEIANSEFWGHPVTSGMYKVDEFVVGSYYTMVPNEYYDGPQPKIQKIIVNFVANSVTAAQAGLLDMYNTNNQADIAELNKLSSMTMFPVDIMFYRYFIVNIEGIDGNTNPVMADARIREAILHAVDRATLAESLFPGLAHISNSGVAADNPASIGTEFAYDPELAHQLLVDAGWDFNTSLRILLYYKDQTSLDFMDAIVYYLGEIGMKAEYTVTSNGTQDLFQTRNYDIGYKGLSAFDISEWYGEYNSTNANFRMINGGDTAFDEYINDYAAATTQEEKNEALKHLQEVEAEKLYKLPLYTIGNNVFINTDHVQLPEGIVFGNPWYKTNIHFEDWELK
jgi:peptide/nickel transport system substrate-binding protein